MLNDNPVHLLALDASSSTIGYVLYDGRAALAHGTIKLPGDLLQRLSLAEVALSDLLVRFSPDAIAYEGPAWQHRNTAIACLQMLGVLRLTAHRQGILDIEISPSAGKLALFGKGKADKETMIRAAASRLAGNLSFVCLQERGAWGAYSLFNHALLYDEHAADALGVAMVAHKLVKKEGVAV